MNLTRRNFITGAATLAAGAAVLPSSAVPKSAYIGPSPWIIEFAPENPDNSYRFLRSVFSRITSNTTMEITMQGSYDGINFHDIPNPPSVITGPVGSESCVGEEIFIVTGGNYELNP